MGEEERIIVLSKARQLGRNYDPFLIPPKLWEIGLEQGYIRQEGERFFVGGHWVMRAEYMEGQ